MSYQLSGFGLLVFLSGGGSGSIGRSRDIKGFL
jgi:hypothetical protein